MAQKPFYILWPMTHISPSVFVSSFSLLSQTQTAPNLVSIDVFLAIALSLESEKLPSSWVNLPQTLAARQVDSRAAHDSLSQGKVYTSPGTKLIIDGPEARVCASFISPTRHFATSGCHRGWLNIWARAKNPEKLRQEGEGG